MVKTLILQSNTKNLRYVEPFLTEIVHGRNIDETRYHNVVIALTEGVNNAIVHGNKRDETKSVTITGEVIGETPDETLVVTIEDSGGGFNPDTLPDPLAPENLLRDGGRGVFLMRSLCDVAEFDNTETGCRTTLKTRLQEKS
ncbi:MAG: ATP-binding protein [Candidatus Kapaibacterium sp.]|nr:MAG: ATP-binding protein [Candidatus Kapabacteria bacterium]